MEYRNLGNSGLKVSEVGLGGNNFGWQITDEQAAISIINHALELGINFIDTAEMYAHGQSEEWIGKAVKGKRDQVIIATKFGATHARRERIMEGPNEGGGSRYWIIKAVESSLRRLNSDYIDLYQIHRPDPTTPIEETLRALDNLVRDGKVRYIGCSNFAAWQLCEALWTSKVRNLESFITIQSEYSLIARGIEREVVPCCQAYGLGVIPHSPLASGFLTGKYRRGEVAPAGTRLGNMQEISDRFLTDANFDMLDKLRAFSMEHGHSVGELAIAWLISHKWISTVIAGGTKLEQLSANVAAAEWKLNAEEIAEVDSITSV